MFIFLNDLRSRRFRSDSDWMNGALFGFFEWRSRPREFRFGNYRAPGGNLKRAWNVRRQLSGVFTFRSRFMTERLLLPGIRGREAGEDAFQWRVDVVFRFEDLKLRVR